MLDPASSVEMVKVLEEDPMVGGVGGDVQVSYEFLLFLECNTFDKVSIYNLQLFLFDHQFLPRS